MRAGASIILVSVAALAACGPAPVRPIPTEYLGAEAQLLGGDLVQVSVTMQGPEGTDAALRAYADCVVSGLALQREMGFARHVRTQVKDEGGIWMADAVYTLSATLPDGLRTIDAGAQVDTCRDNEIPLA